MSAHYLFNETPVRVRDGRAEALTDGAWQAFPFFLPDGPEAQPVAAGQFDRLVTKALSAWLKKTNRLWDAAEHPRRNGKFVAIGDIDNSDVPLDRPQLQGRALAQFYADLFNVLTAAGSAPHAEQVQAVNQELAGSTWLVAQADGEGSGRWTAFQNQGETVLHSPDPNMPAPANPAAPVPPPAKPLPEMKALFAFVTKEAKKAPKGGVTLGGKFYPGGQWIPSEIVEGASAAEKAALGVPASGPGGGPAASAGAAPGAQAGQQPGGATQPGQQPAAAGQEGAALPAPELVTPDHAATMQDASPEAAKTFAENAATRIGELLGQTMAAIAQISDDSPGNLFLKNELQKMADNLKKGNQPAEEPSEERANGALPPATETLLAAGLKASNLPPEKQPEYAEAARSALLAMTPQALERFNGACKSLRFYGSLPELIEAARQEFVAYFVEEREQALGGIDGIIEATLAQQGMTGEWAKLTEEQQGQARDYTKKHLESLANQAWQAADMDNAGGLFNWQTGTVAIDGGWDGPAGATNSIEQIYAHEFCHAVDHVNQEDAVSATPEWQTAFHSELSQGQLSAYATTNASEAFAEFGRLVYADKVSGDYLRQQYPRATAVWEKHQLLPVENTAPLAPLAEVFADEPINQGPVHIDPLANPAETATPVSPDVENVSAHERDMTPAEAAAALDAHAGARQTPNARDAGLGQESPAGDNYDVGEQADREAAERFAKNAAAKETPASPKEMTEEQLHAEHLALAETIRQQPGEMTPEQEARVNDLFDEKLERKRAAKGKKPAANGGKVRGRNAVENALVRGEPISDAERAKYPAIDAKLRAAAEKREATPPAQTVPMEPERPPLTTSGARDSWRPMENTPAAAAVNQRLAATMENPAPTLADPGEQGPGRLGERGRQVGKDRAARATAQQAGIPLRPGSAPGEEGAAQVAAARKERLAQTAAKRERNRGTQPSQDAEQQAADDFGNLRIPAQPKENAPIDLRGDEQQAPDKWFDAENARRQASGGQETPGDALPATGAAPTAGHQPKPAVEPWAEDAPEGWLRQENARRDSGETPAKPAGSAGRTPGPQVEPWADEEAAASQFAAQEQTLSDEPQAAPEIPLEQLSGDKQTRGLTRGLNETAGKHTWEDFQNKARNAVAKQLGVSPQEAQRHLEEAAQRGGHNSLRGLWEAQQQPDAGDEATDAPDEAEVNNYLADLKKQQAQRDAAPLNEEEEGAAAARKFAENAQTADAQEVDQGLAPSSDPDADQTPPTTTPPAAPPTPEVAAQLDDVGAADAAKGPEPVSQEADTNAAIAASTMPPEAAQEPTGRIADTIMDDEHPEMTDEEYQAWNQGEADKIDAQRRAAKATQKPAQQSVLGDFHRQQRENRREKLSPEGQARYDQIAGGKHDIDQPTHRLHDLAHLAGQHGTHEEAVNAALKNKLIEPETPPYEANRDITPMEESQESQKHRRLLANAFGVKQNLPQPQTAPGGAENATAQGVPAHLQPQPGQSWEQFEKQALSAQRKARGGSEVLAAHVLDKQAKAAGHDSLKALWEARQEKQGGGESPSTAKPAGAAGDQAPPEEAKATEAPAAPVEKPAAAPAQAPAQAPAEQPSSDAEGEAASEHVVFNGLAEQAAAGDKQARNKLFEKLQPHLEKWLRGQYPGAREADLKDAIQNANLKLLMAFEKEKVAGKDHFLHWAHTVAANAGRDLGRRQTNRKKHERSNVLGSPNDEDAGARLDPGSKAPDAPQQAMEHERAAALDREIGNLPDKEKVAVQMWREGAKLREIAAKLGMNTTAADRPLKRGLAKLAAALEKFKAHRLWFMKALRLDETEWAALSFAYTMKSLDAAPDLSRRLLATLS